VDVFVANSQPKHVTHETPWAAAPRNATTVVVVYAPRAASCAGGPFLARFVPTEKFIAILTEFNSTRDVHRF
jgi:hypothetical protein